MAAKPRLPRASKAREARAIELLGLPRITTHNQYDAALVDIANFKAAMLKLTSMVEDELRGVIDTANFDGCLSKNDTAAAFKLLEGMRQSCEVTIA